MSKQHKRRRRAPPPPARVPGPATNRREKFRPMVPGQQRDIFERGDDGFGDEPYAHEIDAPEDEPGEVPHFLLVVDCDDEKAMHVLLSELLGRGLRARAMSGAA
jgi:hypothetical protein